MKSILKYLFATLILVGLTSNLYAKDNIYLTDTNVANLINGINSENNGLMRSSIYFAGKYRISETTDALLEILDEEHDASDIVLIALAIYRIGDKEAMIHVLETAKTSDNSKVRNILSAIAIQYFVENNVQHVVKNLNYHDIL